MKRSLMIVTAAFCAVVVAYFAVRTIASVMQGYSWQEMDWHQRRSTSISDFLAASDIGKRKTVRGGEKCIEYYAYKDGLPVKTVCPKQ